MRGSTCSETRDRGKPAASRGTACWSRRFPTKTGWGERFFRSGISTPVTWRWCDLPQMWLANNSPRANASRPLTVTERLTASPDCREAQPLEALSGSGGPWHRPIWGISTLPSLTAPAPSRANYSGGLLFREPDRQPRVNVELSLRYTNCSPGAGWCAQSILPVTNLG